MHVWLQGLRKWENVTFKNCSQIQYGLSKKQTKTLISNLLKKSQKSSLKQRSFVVFPLLVLSAKVLGPLTFFEVTFVATFLTDIMTVAHCSAFYLFYVFNVFCTHAGGSSAGSGNEN